MKPPDHGEPVEEPLPGGIVALLGASLVEHPGGGACRVVSGGGLVAKVGPPGVVAREAAMLAAPLPVRVPVLVDSGPGWIVMTAVGDDGGPWSQQDLQCALADLAQLHDEFEDGEPLPVLRRPFTPAGADALLAPVRRLGVSLPPRLAALLADPAPLLAATADEPHTVLHGDPWPGNVLRPSAGRRVWIDWEMAGVGPAAADLATWLNQTPWHPGVSAEALGRQGEQIEIYLSSRSRHVDRKRFLQALEAASVLWFLAFDVPQLAARHQRAGSRRTGQV